MNALAQIETPQTLPAGITQEDADRVLSYAGKDLAESTRKAYVSQWKGFAAWCEERGATALPAASETVAAYLTDKGPERSRSWLTQASSAIRKTHRTAGREDPTAAEGVRRIIKAIKKEHGTPCQPKAPALVEDVIAMVNAVDRPEPSEEAGPAARARYLRALRDRALILVGYGAALRRSELAGACVEWIEWNAKGIKVQIPRSKGDQEGKGESVAINYQASPRYCPVVSLRRWLQASGIESGPLFRSVPRSAQLAPDAMSGRTVRNVVRRAAKAAGLENVEAFSGHSLRRGCITQAAMNGEPLRKLQKHARHKDTRTTSRYIDAAQIMEMNVSRSLGL